jgi:hypothetical protein
VLQVWRRYRKILNKIFEAYTGNHVGRKGIHFSLKQISLVTQLKQEAMTRVSQKPAQRNRYRQGSGGSVGISKRGMHGEWNCELGRPLKFPRIVGGGRRASVSLPIYIKGVRPPHSTLRRESRSHGEGGGNVA